MVKEDATLFEKDTCTAQPADYFNSEQTLKKPTQSCLERKPSCILDSIAVSVFVVILVEFDKYWESETSRLVYCIQVRPPEGKAGKTTRIHPKRWLGGFAKDKEEAVGLVSGWCQKLVSAAHNP